MIRILNHMDEHGHRVVAPRLTDPDIEREPLFNLSSGYVQRKIATFPKVGTSGPWASTMAYEGDVARLRHGPVTDDALAFSSGDLAARCTV